MITDRPENLSVLRKTLKYPIVYLLKIALDLINEQKSKLVKLLRNFSGVFTKTDKSTVVKTKDKHRINTNDHVPINQRKALVRYCTAI